MTTKTAQIVAAMASALTTAGLTVRETTDQLFSFEDMPCIVLVAGNETPDPVLSTGYVYWNLTVALLIGDQGATPTLAPEPTRATAHTALYADRTLGGLAIDIAVGPIARSIDSENPAAGITQVNYNVKYRALEGQA